MKLTIRRMEPGDLPAIERFNQRLEAAGEAHRVYPESSETKGEGHPLTGRLFVALEGEELRGSVWLHEQDFWIGGEAGRQLRGGFLRLPLSESVINPAFRGVPVSLIMQVLRAQPRLMALGLGAHDTPFARLLAGFKWEPATVPFFFSIVRPTRVLRGLSYARRDPGRRRWMDLAALTGLGAVGGGVLGLRRSISLSRHGRYDAEALPAFGAWADECWERNRAAFDFVPARDSATLNMLFPADFYHGFHRLRVRRAGQDVGLASVLRADFTNGSEDPYFGRLRVGLVADAFCAPPDAAGVLAAATRFLLATDVDLLISFQMHPAWQAGLQDLGYFGGPSNFCWYRAPVISQLLPAGGTAIHLTRADAEGPKWF